MCGFSLAMRVCCFKFAFWICGWFNQAPLWRKKYLIYLDVVEVYLFKIYINWSYIAKL